MKGPILALSLLLLVSAAAATGNDNSVTVWNSQEAAGNCITGANFAQITTADANLFGNCNEAIQIQAFEADCNSITGLNNGRTNFFQYGEMVANDTGCGDFDIQVELLAANENCLTIGNITQTAEQESDSFGAGNVVAQVTAAAIGPVDLGCFELGSSNSVTNGELSQASVLDTCVSGTYNFAVQAALQGEFDNCVTNSKLSQQAAINANILGCDNDGIEVPEEPSIYTNSLADAVTLESDGSVVGDILCLPLQVSVQYADCNALTNSQANQMNIMDEQVTGDANNVGQFVLTGISYDCVTSGSLLQFTDLTARELGCDNNIAQYVDLCNAENSVTSGHMVQQAVINTND